MYILNIPLSCNLSLRSLLGWHFHKHLGCYFRSQFRNHGRVLKIHDDGRHWLDYEWADVHEYPREWVCDQSKLDDVRGGSHELVYPNVLVDVHDPHELVSKYDLSHVRDRGWET